MIQMPSRSIKHENDKAYLVQSLSQIPKCDLLVHKSLTEGGTGMAVKKMNKNFYVCA